MNSEINKALIFTYFSGRATAFQKKMIEEWAAEMPNREQFFVWLQEWEQENLQYYADIDNGMARHWQRLQNQEHSGELPQEEIHASDQQDKRSFISRLNWLVAASVLAVLVTGGLLFKENIQYRIYKTNFSEIARIDLPDGSKVVLNSNSYLKVPRFGFGEKIREVLLDGEADFNITHLANHQRFLVKTDKNLEVEVLGTEFNVYSRPRGAKVILNKGKVALRYKQGETKKSLTMKPGDLVTMDKSGTAYLQETENPEKFSAWKAHRFVFDKTTLREVCHLFEDNFGVKVKIPDPGLASLTISGSFTALNADELLDILTDDSGLEYRRSEDGKTIILSN